MAKKAPTYVRAAQNQYLGRDAVARRHEKAMKVQERWERKHMPHLFVNEPKSFKDVPASTGMSSGRRPGAQPGNKNASKNKLRRMV